MSNVHLSSSLPFFSSFCLSASQSVTLPSTICLFVYFCFFLPVYSTYSVPLLVDLRIYLVFSCLNYIQLFVYRSAYLSFIWLPVWLAICFSGCLSVCFILFVDLHMFIYLLVHRSACLSVSLLSFLPISLVVDLSVYLFFVWWSACLSMSFFVTVCLSISVFVELPVYIFLRLSICMSISLSVSLCTGARVFAFIRLKLSCI